MGRRHSVEPTAEETMIARIDRAIGMERARTLCMRVGGTEVYLTPNPRPGNPVCDAVGPEAARLLWEEVGRGRVLIPLGRARGLERLREEARELDRRGQSRLKIARTLGVHMRTVQRWLETAP